ncbi:MAG: hypothetical protein EAZ47_05715 [Bacteroidetes bacterium]|nr:MAG: hypothetical protein EAY72_04830 [Bacteroidota bacterium]TAF93745.1 MAG: hypothetical protein EAZ47_05715 [Bacteroidota bacterium]
MVKIKPIVYLGFYGVLVTAGLYALHVLEQDFFVIQFTGYQQNFMLQLLTAEQRTDVIDRLLTVSCEGKRAITMYIGSSALLAHVLLIFLHRYHLLLAGSSATWVKYLHWVCMLVYLISYAIIYYYLFQWVMNMEWNAEFIYYYWATRLLALSILVLFALPWIAKLIPTKNYQSES